MLGNYPVAAQRAASQKWLSCIKGSWLVSYVFGRAIAEAVGRRLPTSVARVRGWVKSRGICDGRSGTGSGFLRVLRFPLPILIPPTAPHSSSSVIRSWRRTKWTQSHPTRKIIIKNSYVLSILFNLLLLLRRAVLLLLSWSRDHTLFSVPSRSTSVLLARFEPVIPCAGTLHGRVRL
jgi:hypothetical protein